MYPALEYGLNIVASHPCTFGTFIVTARPPEQSRVVRIAGCHVMSGDCFVPRNDV